MVFLTYEKSNIQAFMVLPGKQNYRREETEQQAVQLKISDVVHVKRFQHRLLLEYSGLFRAILLSSMFLQHQCQQ